MEVPRKLTTTAALALPLPLHTVEIMCYTAIINRAFTIIYTCAIFTLFYYHAMKILHSTTSVSLSVSLCLLVSDAVLAFMWATAQPFRMRPVRRRVLVENLEQVLKKNSDFPALDVFICTADPYKEPPTSLLNTAISVMAYDYPTEKVSVYVSDDGGSKLTLFACTEAAEFARHWLPFCKNNNILERCPEAYFTMNYPWSPETEEIKVMYETMKMRVENVVERGEVCDEYITSQQKLEAFNRWTDNKFTCQDHPTLIQVLLENEQDRDITGRFMPNFIYVTRQKSSTSPHNFKAGALNVLLRVSATMTNAPIILTLDCDTYSNDPQTPKHVLCYLLDPKIGKSIAYIQFPQRFHGLNKDDIYASEAIRWFQINAMGLDGWAGPDYIGTGCFFSRRAFFGGPSCVVSPEISELSPDHVVDKSIQSQPILELAHHVAGCSYENKTSWGSKMGFRYGSLCEDTFTGYQMQCEGWKSVFYNPERAAFLGDKPINLHDVLTQMKRWVVGLLEVGFSKYCPLTFGTRTMGTFMAFCYANYLFWSIWFIPIIVYAFLPQLALLTGVSIFPKLWDPWFLLYMFLFIGAYGQDLVEFILLGATVQRWWNDQRMWIVRGLSSHFFGSVEYLLKYSGISMLGFSLTSKVIDEEQSKRYHQGMFEFGVPSPMFVPLTMASVINLAALVQGFMHISSGRDLEGLLAIQMFIAGFGVVNCWPVYEAMILRTDKGRLPIKTLIISIILAWALYVTFSVTVAVGV